MVSAHSHQDFGIDWPKAGPPQEPGDLPMPFEPGKANPPRRWRTSREGNTMLALQMTG